MITIFLNIFVAILNDSYEDSKLEEDDEEDNDDTAESDFAEKFLPSLNSFIYPLVLYFYIDFFENFYIRSFYPSNVDDVIRWFEKYVIAKKGITHDDDADNNNNNNNSQENSAPASTNAQGAATITNSQSPDERNSSNSALLPHNSNNGGKKKNDSFNWAERYIRDHMNEFLHEKDLVSHLFFSEKHMYTIFDVDSIVSLLDEIRQSNSEFVENVNEINIHKYIHTFQVLMYLFTLMHFFIFIFFA